MNIYVHFAVFVKFLEMKGNGSSTPLSSSFSLSYPSLQQTRAGTSEQSTNQVLQIILNISTQSECTTNDTGGLASSAQRQLKNRRLLFMSCFPVAFLCYLCKTHTTSDPGASASGVATMAKVSPGGSTFSAKVSCLRALCDLCVGVSTTRL